MLEENFYRTQLFIYYAFLLLGDFNALATSISDFLKYVFLCLHERSAFPTKRRHGLRNGIKWPLPRFKIIIINPTEDFRISEFFSPNEGTIYSSTAFGIK